MIAKETPNFFIASPLAARPARGQLTSTLSSGPAPVPPLRPVDFRLAGVLNRRDRGQARRGERHKQTAIRSLNRVFPHCCKQATVPTSTILSWSESHTI